jgi:DNA-binding IscR family transcriptional regulator
MLARSEGENVKSECLAASVNTNAVVIRRLLSQLAHADLVASQTGAAGGTRLAKRPEDIRLVDVYHAVSCGEVFALHPKGPNRDCPVGRGIETVLCNLQKEIDLTVGQKLAEYTLGDVLGKIEGAAV